MTGEEKLTPFSAIDEALELADSPQYPVNVHFEVKVTGRLDAAQLRAAVQTALRAHPLSRARKLPPKPKDKLVYWAISESTGTDPFLVVEGVDDAGVRLARNQLLSTQVPLHDAPPLRVWLIRSETGDHVVLNVHHAAADGIGSLRFMRSIIRAYNNEVDPTPDFDAIEARDLEQFFGASSRTEKSRRLQRFLKALSGQVAECTAVSKSSDISYAGYGCHHLTLEADEVEKLNPNQHIDATFNDLLVAAMHRTVEVWNESLHDSAAIVRVMSPVNLRPREWWFEIFGNFAISFATNSKARHRNDAARLIKKITEQSRVAKRKGFAEALLVGMNMSSKLPTWAKELLFQEPGERPTTSAVLTNAGKIADELSFGDDNNVVEVWLSPPSVMPDGLGLGVTHYDSRLHLSFRHSRELLDDDAIKDLAELFRQSLHWLS